MGSQTRVLIKGVTLDRFTLPRVRGGTLALDDVVEERRALLVFYRGGWCPLCSSQLAKLSLHYDAFAERGVELLAISNEPATKGVEMAKKFGPPFPLLVDAESALIKRLGLEIKRRDVIGVFRRKFNYAQPAVVLIDRDRVVRWVYVGENFSDRPPIERILEAIDDASGVSTGTLLPAQTMSVVYH